MNTTIIRENVRSIILGLTGFTVFLLIVRFVTEFFNGANPQNGLLIILYDVTDSLSSPFVEIIDTGRLENFNIAVLLAAGTFILVGIALTELFLAFIQDSFLEIARSVLDLLFKILEALLFLRIINDFFLLSADSNYVSFITDSTSWAANIFDINVILDGRIQPGIFIMLIIIAAADYYTDVLLRKSVNKNNQSSSFDHRKSTRVFAQPQQPQSAPQNITVNIPPAQQTVVVNREQYQPQNQDESYNFYRDGVRQ